MPRLWYEQEGWLSWDWQGEVCAYFMALLIDLLPPGLTGMVLVPFGLFCIYITGNPDFFHWLIPQTGASVDFILTYQLSCPILFVSVVLFFLLRCSRIAHGRITWRSGGWGHRSGVDMFGFPTATLLDCHGRYAQNVAFFSEWVSWSLGYPQPMIFSVLFSALAGRLRKQRRHSFGGASHSWELQGKPTSWN